MWQVGSEWAYFNAVTFRTKVPSIRWFHSTCFNASVVPGTRLPGSSPRPGQAASPLAIIKNVYSLSPMFIADSTRLIVNRNVKDILSKNAILEFLPVTIDTAWDYPYEPGNRNYELDDVYADEDDLERIEMSFAHKYRIPAPQVELYEVVDYGFKVSHRECVSGSGMYWDKQIYKMHGTIDGCTSGNCVVSRQLINEVGLYRSWGYICYPELLDMLLPFMRKYYFWYHKLQF